MKLDRRSKRTHTTLFDTLISLIEEKDYADISIKELTDRADIARKTFYRNYSNMDDILLSRMDVILEEYFETIRKDLDKRNDLYWSFEVEQLIAILQRNAVLFKALQKTGLAIQALEKLSDFFLLLHKKANNLNELDENHHYLVNYHAGGIYHVLNNWFEKDMLTPPQVIVDFIRKTVKNINLLTSEYLDETKNN